MNETDLYTTNDVEAIIKFLQSNSIIYSNMNCNKTTLCNNASMIFTKRCGGDGWSWRCPVCRTFKSIRFGSFFDSMRLPVDKLIKIMIHFANDISIADTVKMLNIARSSVGLIYQIFR